ncbi:DUF6879 family protein [Actinacidiphila paucisporea]|uniref:DUF6879 domain-containing protein n=1 Tax=Actinacidiphila paucisporea TaxID=310782 RepID=A0A1M7BU91_9ACTN|nr:DUF6879 family protein [Actinacidiphila paucisporea]SHL58504.1 hypothetical protein SAMN05216499_10545 [Actinacidiphila paucisporea]
MQPPAREALAGALRSAVHLELRDSYMLDDPGYLAYQQGRRLDIADRASWWNGWHDAVAAAAARGVTVRRARVVSEPLHPYGLYEYDLTPGNLAAGEDVRWLSRRRAADLLLPAVDFWVFDDETVLLHHFTGGGRLADDGREYRTDAALAKTFSGAFEAVWERATPHAEYIPAT